MDVITSIETVRKRVKLVVNETEVLYLTPRQLRERGYAQGEELSLDELKKNLLLEQYPYALNKAVQALAVRPRSRGEIEASLRQKLMMDETIEMVIYKLEKEGFLNDADFASDWAQSRTKRMVGTARIRQELRQKGVDSELIDIAVDELDEDEAAAAADTLARKLLKRYQNEEPKKAMEKALAAMQRRGFSYPEAAKSLQAAIQAERDE